MSLFKNNRRNRRAASKQRRSRLETLESRKLMAANLSATGIWDISGTHGSDEIYVARNRYDSSVLIVELNGRIVAEENAADVKAIHVNGGRGNDLIEIYQTDGAINLPTRLIGGQGNDVIVGGDGNDFIDGGAGHDELVGGGGNDVIFGRGGDDYLEGGSGQDQLDGGSGWNELGDASDKPSVTPTQPTTPVKPTTPTQPTTPVDQKPVDEAPTEVAKTNRVPAEWERHDSTWMQWPKGEEASYRDNFAGIIGTLQAYEQVNLAVESTRAQADAERFLKSKNVPLENVQFHVMPYDWSWMRDNGAIWVEQTSATGEQNLIVQDWGFDGWGGDGGPSRKDDAVPCKVAAIEGVACEAVEVTLEKGTLEFNGKDTVISSWTVLHDRNPTMSRAELDAVLKEKFGVSTVVWIEGASQGDLTDGHVDGIARFVNENTVVVSRYVDQSDPDSALFENAAAKIAAAGFNVVRMDIPGYVQYRGEWLPANYTNYLVANDVVVASSYGNEAFDNNARRQLQQLFPGRDIVLTDTRELWYNGGAVHCVTNDQPFLAGNATPVTEVVDPVTPDFITPIQPGVESKPEANPMDVNGDGFVTPADALMVINQLVQDRYPGQVDKVMSERLQCDVNKDGEVTPIDVLLILDELFG
ncbi:MAG: agmatine deiminase family protein [Rubripirellula sp.]